MTGKPYTVADLLETGRAELHSQLDQLELDTPAEELAAWQRAFE
ncbi:hypothetical protein [Deinococcus sp.]